MSMKNLRTGAYIVPYCYCNLRLEIAFIEYARGVGFIGGGLERAETPETALAREIDEKVAIFLLLMG